MSNDVETVDFDGVIVFESVLASFAVVVDLLSLDVCFYECMSRLRRIGAAVIFLNDRDT